ncbi:hypothetical protein HYS91_05820 [Candidatus Daviesbacteria bacterium]|nr:hypothetical protein [Candidatus Daviesbacteria bacterium]
MMNRNETIEEFKKNVFIPGVSNTLESTGFRTPPQSPSLQEGYSMEKQGTYEKLNELFEDQNSQQRRVQEAREILGDSAKDLTDDQVFELASNVQFLVDIWEEEFEKEVFGGKTLNELLGINKL